MSTDAEAERIWTSCAQSIRSQVSDAVWRTTFSGARATAFDQRSLTLVVPTSLQKARIERRYFDLLTDALDEAEPDVMVRIEIDPDWDESEDFSVADVAAPAEAAPALRDADREPGAAGTNGDTGPHARLTFEQFVTGTSNRFSQRGGPGGGRGPGPGRTTRC